MRKELQDQLYEKYPKIFPNPGSRDSAMYWGLACGDGWYNVLNTLCSTIQNHLDWRNCEGQYAHVLEHRSKLQTPVPQLVADQIKEKFGTLRFYCHGGDEYCRGAISVIESLTHKMCEDCGNVGEHRQHGWVATRCDPCEEKWVTEREKRNRETAKPTGD